ncbi:hypothetical protein TNCT_271691 [Trichonephila clavata]|uniref:Reverse transcriptase/retrotransposon-derived protein RNase H-like domain-containing protein n=1 Tax=Trichonephila clavata TaxID=2740835 RepID=A0A8X6G402_TRICU|nr:hypothetical protein TNCT_271691 [Trichonephila clavata]
MSLSARLRNSAEFHFGHEHKEAFKKLKEIFSAIPLLHIFKRRFPLELHMEASSWRLVAVLQPKSESG